MPDVVDVRALAQAVTNQHAPSGGDICRLCFAEWPCLPRRLADAVLAQHDQQHARDETIRELVEQIAKPMPPPDYCTCGHKPDFCHKVNANRWCGGHETWAVWKARDVLAALGDRATPNTETP